MATLRIETEDSIITIENSELIPATEKELQAIVDKAITGAKRKTSKEVMDEIVPALQAEVDKLRTDAEQYVLSLKPKDGVDGKDGEVTNEHLAQITKDVVEMVLEMVDDGADGEDGYTPIKGVDYLTEDDKVEIALSVESQLAPMIIEETKPEVLRDKLESFEDGKGLDYKSLRNRPTIPDPRKYMTPNTNRLRDQVDFDPTGTAGQLIALQADGTFALTDDAVLTQEQVEDFVGAMIVAGTNIDDVTYDDGAGTITINAADQGITLDTQANVKTTNTSGKNSFTTDTKEEYIEDGTDFWLHQLPLIKDRTGSNGNPGPYDGQPRNYHPDFISGVDVYNAKLVNVRLGPADVNPQSFQLKGATADSVEEAQIYLNGAWRTFLTGVRLRQDSNTQLEYNIDGTDIWVDITDGNSNNIGIDGRPVIQDWQNDPGAGSVRRIFKSVVYDALGYAPTGEKEGVRGVQVQAADLDKADFLGQLYQGEIIVVTDDLSASKEMTTLMFPKVDAPTQSQLVPVQLQHITTVTASSVTLDTSYYTVLCDTSSNSITINLPAAADYQGFIYNIKLIDATNSVTIDGNGSETIDGSTTLAITALYDSVTIQCDGSNWFII